MKSESSFASRAADSFSKCARTFPNTALRSRAVAMSAKQSPPTANAVARSSTTFLGSNCANDFRQDARPVDNADASPVASAVRSYVRAPACDTTPVPVAWTGRAGNDDVD